MYFLIALFISEWEHTNLIHRTEGANDSHAEDNNEDSNLHRIEIFQWK